MYYFCWNYNFVTICSSNFASLQYFKFFTTSTSGLKLKEYMHYIHVKYWRLYIMNCDYTKMISVQKWFFLWKYKSINANFGTANRTHFLNRKSGTSNRKWEVFNWLTKFSIFLRRFATNVFKIVNVNSKIAINWETWKGGTLDLD